MKGWKNALVACALVALALALPGCLSAATDAMPGIVTLPPGVSSSMIKQSCAVSCEWSGVGGACGTTLGSSLVDIPWMQLAFLGVLVVMLALSVIYMASVVMKRVDWLVFVKEEFYQALISAILILVISWFAMGACEVSWAVAGQDPFQAADIYLNNLIWQKTVSYATNFALDSIYLQITAAFFLPMGLPPGGLRPMAGLDAVAGVYDFMFSITSTIFSSLLMQVIMLKLIQAFMFKIVLPLGIFFRVFPFLRQAGATFIAIALAFYLVMPMMYVLDKAVVEQTEGVAMIDSNSPGLQQKWFGNDPNLITYTAELGHVDFFGVVGNLGKLIPQAVFLPALNTVVAYTFMRSMAKMLGQKFPSPFE